MVVRQRISIEEFLALPEDDVSKEYVDGEVVEKVSPKFKHSIVERELLKLIEQSGAARDFEAIPETRYIFGEPQRVYVPGVSIVHRERLQRDEDGEFADEQRLAPDIAIEILSPGQSAGRLIEKLTFYMANGVEIALVVDNERHQVTLYRPGDEPRTIAEPAAVNMSPVIPGLAIDLAELFAALRKPKQG
jgi:Uma2 family endonuclease